MQILHIIAAQAPQRLAKVNPASGHLTFAQSLLLKAKG